MTIRTGLWTWLTLSLLGAAAGCPMPAGAPDAGEAPSGWDWGLPDHVPQPRVPEDNPMSAAKVTLGRRLFFDDRLSSTGTFACASCHEQDRAFTDGVAFPEGESGDVLTRNSMSLTNVVYNSTFTWANPALVALESQARVPLFSEHPIELGVTGHEDEILARLADDEDYPTLFVEAFPDDDEPIHFQSITFALAAFERTLLSFDSPYDRWLQGDLEAMPDAARRGRILFVSEALECFHCHGGFNFSDSIDHAGSVFDEVAFHNNGLYNLGDEGAYPPGNQGLYELTGVESDRGRFRAPTLRNIAVTGPYMHDGSIETLEEVIDHYAAGGRTIDDGAYAGVGADNPHKSSFVSGFLLTDDEKADLLAFLEALTDETFLDDPRHRDPFAEN